MMSTEGMHGRGSERTCAEIMRDGLQMIRGHITLSRSRRPNTNSYVVVGSAH